MTDYRIETLAATFAKHADEGDRNRKQSIKNHNDAFPESDIPDWIKNDFNIARALSVMAAEIERLKTICN